LSAFATLIRLVSLAAWIAALLVLAITIALLLLLTRSLSLGVVLLLLRIAGFVLTHKHSPWTARRSRTNKETARDSPRSFGEAALVAA
jgi:hypothetical protein